MLGAGEGEYEFAAIRGALIKLFRVTMMNDYVQSLNKLKLNCWTLPCQECFKFGVGDPAVCKTACFILVFIHRACAIMRVFRGAKNINAADRQRHIEYVLEARIDLKNDISIFPGAADLQGKVLRESRAGHLMVPV